MALPIELKTSRPKVLELWNTPIAGYLLALFFSLFPFAVVVIPALPLLSRMAHVHLNSDHGLAINLLLAVPWNLGLWFSDVKVKIFFVPAWAFCLVMGAFGLAKAQGLLD